MKLKMECLLSCLGLWSSLDERSGMWTEGQLEKRLYNSFFIDILNLVVLNTHHGFTLPLKVKIKSQLSFLSLFLYDILNLVVLYIMVSHCH